MCEYGQIDVDIQSRPICASVSAKDVLPLVIVPTPDKQSLERLVCPQYQSMLIPNNQVAARRIAKHLYLLGDNGTEDSLIDYIMGLCDVDLTMVMTGYLRYGPGVQLPQFRKARMRSALANIESNLKMDGRLLSDKLTIAEFAIFEIQLWLSAVFGQSLFRECPKIMETVNLIRNDSRLKACMEGGIVKEVEQNIKGEVEAMMQLVRVRFPVEKKAKLEEDVGSKRNSILLNAFYAHLTPQSAS